jgi:hypothetical protein
LAIRPRTRSGSAIRRGIRECGGLGELRIDGIVGDLFTGNKSSFANPDLSASLGGGVLNRFTVAFDYVAKRMYLAPNANFGKPDAFDRSGLWTGSLGPGDCTGNDDDVVPPRFRERRLRAAERSGDSCQKARRLFL